MSYQKFYQMINQVPRVARLWDQKNNDLKTQQFEQQLGLMSSGEKAMAQFFASVWAHDNTQYGFDLADIVSRIDKRQQTIIANWVTDPFWP